MAAGERPCGAALLAAAVFSARFQASPALLPHNPLTTPPCSHAPTVFWLFQVKYQYVRQTRVPASLPQVLAVNCGLQVSLAGAAGQAGCSGHPSPACPCAAAV